MLNRRPTDFLATELIPSYFALETRVIPEGGYVIRFDSFSKLLSAGMRLVSLRRTKRCFAPDWLCRALRLDRNACLTPWTTTRLRPICSPTVLPWL